MFSDNRTPNNSMIESDKSDDGVSIENYENKHLTSSLSDEVNTVMEKEDTQLRRKIIETKKNNKVKKGRIRPKMICISSSDEDIPLSYFAKRAWTASLTNPEEDFNDEVDQHDVTNESSRETDFHSTDSELQDILDNKKKHILKKERKIKHIWDTTVQSIKSNKGKMKNFSPRKLKKSHKQAKQNRQKIASQEKSTADIINQVLMESLDAAKLQKQIAERETAKVDSLLTAYNLTREHIRPYGNCFFESSAKQLNITATSLRHQLCKSFEDNLEDYITFVLSSHHPDDEEGFVKDYLTEIEKLKQDGYWTSDVADLHPLVLANFSQRPVTLYTNKEQQIIKVSPARSCQAELEVNDDIKLAYISIPGVLEHYDACSDILPAQEVFTATPIVNKNCDKDSHIPDSPSKIRQNPQIKSPVKKNTPRKRAVFITPEKKLFTRKRKATPENWKKNIRKRLRLSGEQYTSAEGKVMPSRSLQPIDCSKCRLKCETKISHEQRQQLFDSFWNLGHYERQKDFVCARVEEENTKTYLDETGKAKSKRKQVTRKFSFEIDGMKYQICKTYFMKTLSIGKAYVDNAMKYKKGGRFTGKDLRGKHVPHNKLSRNQNEYVKRHIESFQRVCGHYVRKGAKREFLGPELTLPKMYELYVEKCKLDDKEPVKMSKYRQIFNSNYNSSLVRGDAYKTS